MQVFDSGYLHVIKPPNLLYVPDFNVRSLCMVQLLLAVAGPLHIQGFRLFLGAFRTSVESLHVDGQEPSLGARLNERINV